MSGDYEALTPVQVEQQMGQALGYIKERVEAVNVTRVHFKKMKREYKLAFEGIVTDPAKKGTRADREGRALIECAAEWEAMDIAEAGMQYATDLVNIAERELSALQTVAKLVLQSYNVVTR